MQVQTREIEVGGVNVIQSAVQRYDSLGRLKYDEAQTLSGAFSVVRTNYDNFGRASTRSAPYFPGAAVYHTMRSYTTWLADRLQSLVR